MPEPSAVGVIFDMDGVLIESREAHYASWCRLGEELGTPCPRQIFDDTFGMHNRQIIPLWVEGKPSEQEIDRLSARKEELFRSVAAQRVEVLPGARELIADLTARGWALAIGSSAPAANVELVLDLLGVRDCFHALSTGDEVTRGKPHPDVFLIAARKLGLPPRRCIVIEDAPQGVEAAIAAGAQVVAVTTTKTRQELQRADSVVGSLLDLSADTLLRLVNDG